MIPGEKNVPRKAEVAVLIPCYNEVATVGRVVADFHACLPDARIYVYDNNSTDETAHLAAAAGAIVVPEKRQGKGFVLQSMLADVDADYYILVDGDGTYPADKAQELLQPVIDGKADMVVGVRLNQYVEQSFRPFHVFGNRLVVALVNRLFGARLRDIMSGYRAFNRRFAESVPIVSKGFEIETELTLQALYRDMVLAEIPVPYGRRPEGSFSKLSTLRDGARVLVKIVDILKAYRPLLFFSLVGGVIGGLGLLVGAIPIVEFFQTGKVLHFPSAILAAAMEIVAAVCVGWGLVMDSINHHFKELANLLLKTRRKDNNR